jgi:hypothetical protein
MTTETKRKDELTVVTPPATACYAFVWEPRQSLTPGTDPQYSITLVFPKTTDLSTLKRAAKAAVAKKWGDKPPPGLRSPFRDGDEDRPGDPVFANSTFISAKSKQQPGIVDHARRPILEQTAFYSGVRCRAEVYAFAYDKNGNRGVTFFLNNLQKLGDGARLAGRRPAESVFDEVEPEPYMDDNTPF